MKCQQFLNIHITDPITICHHKSFVTNVFLDTFDTSTSHRIQTCINYRHFPLVKVLIMNNNLTFSFCGIVKRYITIVKKIICEPFFDNMLLIPCTDNKIIKSVIRVFLHNMPQNRLAPNFNHRFRLIL